MDKEYATMAVLITFLLALVIDGLLILPEVYRWVAFYIVFCVATYKFLKIYEVINK